MGSIDVKITERLQTSKAFTAFAESIKDRMQTCGTTIFSGRNTIKVMDVESGEGENLRVVVKHFRKPNLLKKLGYVLGGKTKARKAFDNGQELLARGIATPEPYAAVDYTCCGIACDSYLLTAEESLPPVEDKLPVYGTDAFDKATAEAFAGFVAEMHGKGILHHDLNPTNVRYRKTADGRLQFSLIDINRMTFYPSGTDIPMKDCMENMTRFTGRMDIFEYVARQYARCRNLDEQAFCDEAVAQKKAHDAAWRRKKRLAHPFRR